MYKLIAMADSSDMTFSEPQEIVVKKRLIKKQKIDKPVTKVNSAGRRVYPCITCGDDFTDSNMIRCRNFNNTENTPCTHESCKDCFKRWLLREEAFQADCMHCQAVYSRDDLVKKLGSNWTNTVYAKKRASILFSLTKAKLPLVQHKLHMSSKMYTWQYTQVSRANGVFDRIHRIMRQAQADIMSLQNMFSELMAKYRDNPDFVLPEVFREFPNITVETLQTIVPPRVTFTRPSDGVVINNSVQELVNQAQIALGRRIVTTNSRTSTPKPPDPSLETRSHCPVADCRGFIGIDWVCGICEVLMCKRCMKTISKESSHKCTEEDIETAKFFLSKTKHCPGCKTRIFRSSGCDQMWCPTCHIAFNWASLEILNTARIHNPEYEAFMIKFGASNIRQPVLQHAQTINGYREYFPCDINIAVIDSRRFDVNGSDTRHEFMSVIRRALHNLDQQRRIQGNGMEDKAKLKCFEYSKDYLTNKTSEAEFQQLIQQQEKAVSKAEEVFSTRLNWADSVLNIFAHFMNNRELTLADLRNMITANDALAKSSMDKIGHNYHSTVPRYCDLD